MKTIHRTQKTIADNCSFSEVQATEVATASCAHHSTHRSFNTNRYSRTSTPRHALSRHTFSLFTSRKIEKFFEKCRKFNLYETTFGKGGGGVLESRISSPYPGANPRRPPPRMKGSTARAHRRDATAAQAEALANHWGCARRRKA